MADNNVARLGQINNAGIADALFLKAYGEFLAAFERETVTTGRVFTRSVSGMKSAQFPVMGRTTARYHTPGTEIVGQLIQQDERIITLDQLLISDYSVAEIDEVMNHYELRSEAMNALGNAIAWECDANNFRVMIQAARSAGMVGLPGGSALNVANAKTNSDDLAAAIFQAGVEMRTKFVPYNDNAAFILPVQYSLLAQNTKLLNRDWGGAGVYSDGKVFRVAGIELVETNNLPTTDVTGTFNNKYNVNATTTAAIVSNKRAVGMLTLIEKGFEATWETRRQSTLMLGKTAVGHGVLRPECAVEIRTGNPV